MNILLLTDNYIPEMNANARIFSELAEIWGEKGHNVSVITSHPNFPRGIIHEGYKNTWLKVEVINKVTLHRVKTYMHPNIGFIRRVLDFLSFGLTSFLHGLTFKRKKIDVVVGVTPQFFCALSACLLAQFKKKPFALILCDLWPDSVVANQVMKKNLMYRGLKKIELWMYRKSAAIFILSNSFRVYLIENGISPDKIHKSISGADIKSFYPREKNKQLQEHYQLKKHLTVGYIGTFGVSQCIEELVSVAHHPSLKETTSFLFIGDGANRKLLLEKSAEELNSNIIIDGPFSCEKIPEYWSLIDIAIVVLKDTETNQTVMPSKMLEAMAMGIPVILYAIEGEAQQFLEESQAGFFVKNGDIDGLINLITSIQKNKNSLTIFKKNAYATAMHFTREAQAVGLLDQFSKIKYGLS